MRILLVIAVAAAIALVGAPTAQANGVTFNGTLTQGDEYEQVGPKKLKLRGTDNAVQLKWKDSGRSQPIEIELRDCATGAVLNGVILAANDTSTTTFPLPTGTTCVKAYARVSLIAPPGSTTDAHFRLKTVFFEDV